VRRFGDRDALSGLDLEVGRGEVVVLTGPNGAGKTTLLRVLATVLRPTIGEVAVEGRALPRQARAVRGRIGFLAHEPLVYPELTVTENLELYAALHRVDGDRVVSLRERVGLARRGNDRVAELSRGMRQRLAIGRTLLHDPSLLLLDEPTASLDEEGRSLLREVLGDGGRTVLAATHEPEWFAGVATRQVRVRSGRVAA
jgi:heme ABC exporter ATP-binding subunit CcmA